MNKNFVIFILLLIVLYLLFSNQSENNNLVQECPCGANCQCNLKNPLVFKLWNHHFVYTRLVMMAFFRSDPELDTLVKRFEKNQEELGAALGSVFKNESHVQEIATKELKKHMELAVEVMTAIKQNDESKQKTSIEAFYANADDIGKYLDGLYKTNKFRHHMKHHIDYLIENVLAFVNKQYSDDVSSLNKYLNAGTEMAYDMA